MQNPQAYEVFFSFWSPRSILPGWNLSQVAPACHITSSELIVALGIVQSVLDFDHGAKVPRRNHMA